MFCYWMGEPYGVVWVKALLGLIRVAGSCCGREGGDVVSDSSFAW